MFRIEPLRKKALLYYESGRFHADILNGREIFPLRYPFKKPSEKALVASIEEVREQMATLRRSGTGGYIEYRTLEYKTIGRQRLPAALSFETQDEFLRFLGKEEEYRLFEQGFEEARKLGLGEFLRQKPQILLKNPEHWRSILAVVRFFLENPKPGIYLRELPIEGIDSKFIQSHKKILDTLLQELLEPESYDASITRFSNYGFERKYGLRYPSNRVRFRTLDPEARVCGVEDMEIACEAFNSLNLRARRIFIIENLTTFLAFASLPSALAIYGGGFKAGQLAELDLSFAEELYYWGDIDTHGFAILSSVRSAHKRVRSFLMDRATMNRFAQLCVEEPSPTEADLPNLTPEEAALYDELRFGAYRAMRLEQERIAMAFAMQRVEAML